MINKLLPVSMASVCLFAAGTAIADGGGDKHDWRGAKRSHHASGHWSMGKSPVAGGLKALEARVAALESALLPATVNVDCATDSLADAVAGAAAGSTILVNGHCTEPLVEVLKSGVTIEGANPGRVDGLTGQLRVRGAQGVTLRNLTVDNFGTAVQVREGGSARIEDLTATADFDGSGNDGYAVFLTRNSYAELTNVDLTAEPGALNALILNDGSAARTNGGRFISRGEVFSDNTAIGLYRSCSLRMNGNPTIANESAAPGINRRAVDVFHTSNFRTNDDISGITGNVAIGNNSAARIRRLGGPAAGGPGTIDGFVAIVSDSNLEIGTRDTATVTGTVRVEDQSLLIGGSGSFGAVNVPSGIECGAPGMAGMVKNSSRFSGPVSAGCNIF